MAASWCSTGPSLLTLDAIGIAQRVEGVLAAAAVGADIGDHHSACVLACGWVGGWGGWTGLAGRERPDDLQRSTNSRPHTLTDEAVPQHLCQLAAAEGDVPAAAAGQQRRQSESLTRWFGCSETSKALYSMLLMPLHAPNSTHTHHPATQPTWRLHPVRECTP